MILNDGKLDLFQSTPPRGRRPGLQIKTIRVTGFNPRLREGGDKVSVSVETIGDGFNPRLREGGDIGLPA